jgi:hypothetical protein
MEKPKCRICREKHWSTEEHSFPDVQTAVVKTSASLPTEALKKFDRREYQREYMREYMKSYRKKKGRVAVSSEV